ncbi:lipoprotein [Enterococcus quebecensis]|uniref:Lipoprotein n=1 Tax=Enterococcus quebecensis TaxID=903983 RepID=A0A1E5GRY9_9ENTE|nr:lipoprotein [Enterococcus quebecensis]OEG15335.1 hypothetical protein BCR23_10905 [Enterococcus quebecensis]OJG72298.1 hypothetical protein RV12_GL001004 [Enterococcus quebecensis]
MKKKLFFVLGAILLLSGCSNSNEPNKSLESSTSNSSKNSTSKASEGDSTKQVSSKSSEKQLTQETTTEDVIKTYPYEVSLDTFKANSVFGKKGMNVPNTIEFSFENASQGVVSFKFNTPEQEHVTSYRASYQQVPTKTIRIFSAENKNIRTVNVNTELVLGERVYSDQDRIISGNLYTFMNKNGGVSLITPNYAGNVAPEDTDVMLEYLPR